MGRRAHGEAHADAVVGGAAELDAGRPVASRDRRYAQCSAALGEAVRGQIARRPARRSAAGEPLPHAPAPPPSPPPPSSSDGRVRPISWPEIAGDRRRSRISPAQVRDEIELADNLPSEMNLFTAAESPLRESLIEVLSVVHCACRQRSVRRAAPFLTHLLSWPRRITRRITRRAHARHSARRRRRRCR